MEENPRSWGLGKVIDDDVDVDDVVFWIGEWFSGLLTACMTGTWGGLRCSGRGQEKQR